MYAQSGSPYSGAICAKISYRGCTWQFFTQKIPKKGSGLNQRLGQLPEQKEPAQVMSRLFQKLPIPEGLH